MYPYNPITYVSITDMNMGFRGDFDKLWWRTLHGAGKRNRILWTWSNHHIYIIGIDVIDVILGAERTAASLSHVFPLPTRTWVLGGDFDKSWWRTLHGAGKRNRILWTWSNHHIYIGIDVIDVILGAERTAASLSHMFPLPTRTWVLGGDFDKSWWRTLHGAGKRDRILWTWSNHHIYIGIDVIDVHSVVAVSLCCQQLSGKDLVSGCCLSLERRVFAYPHLLPWVALDIWLL